jgi:hypothetical protein
MMSWHVQGGGETFWFCARIEVGGKLRERFDDFLIAQKINKVKRQRRLNERK